MDFTGLSLSLSVNEVKKINMFWGKKETREKNGHDGMRFKKLVRKCLSYVVSTVHNN